MTAVETQALDILQRVFGFDRFREPQLEVIETVTKGSDCLVIMPTGGGKSLCYQLPALMMDGTAIIISPLIALMQDQVNAARQVGIKAEYLNSTLSFDQQQQVMDRLNRGELDLLYMAPERLQNTATMDALQSAKISLIAIDEAHCVSQWGHDFRPDYLMLAKFKEVLPSTPMLALTATANDLTRDEIVERLELQNPRRFIKGFDRPNIYYQVSLKTNPRSQLKQFLESRRDQCGIVYCLSRKKTEQTAAWLSDQGFDARPYHAGLSTEERAANQDHFLTAERSIIVATIAFGMGIDKPDVRFVVHLDLPKSIEAYYQETGRAGRDGAPADVFLLYGLQDVVLLKQMVSNSSEQQNRIENHKLDTMLAFCELTSCRRQAILNYFGETASDHCGYCDTCVTPPDTFDATEVVQKALSAIYKTGQRFGANYVIDVLHGKESDRIFQFDHHNLSVFGIGKALSYDEWRGVLRQLVVRGLIIVDVKGYGGLKLHESCRAILKGEQEIFLQKMLASSKGAKQKKKTQRLDTDILDYDELLFERLRDWRSETAKAANLPPYTILHDSSLKELAAFKPRTEAELLNIGGIGEAKLERFGQALLNLLE